MRTVRNVLLAALVATVFLTSYSLATAWSGQGSPTATTVSGPGVNQAGGFAQSGAGVACGCCPPAGGGQAVEGRTVVEGDVQRISVDASVGYNPNVIRATAGVPLEITFSQGSGCMAQVFSRDLGFFEDLTTGPKTIQIPALQPGEYGFACGMEMVFGSIVVE
ncbi:MAG TPA: cupredoxin domain-containing protein [Coriobacteriia bacterium]|nr:cupredoxin domain-containing protein [Coriobacteriia bacterium]